MMTETQYLKQARAAAASLDGNRWELARIAAEMKAAGISEYAEKIGALDEVRRSARTVTEWAQAAEFRETLMETGAHVNLPFSFHARASRYVDRVDWLQLVEVLEAYSVSTGGTFESFCAALSELAEPDGYHDAPAVIRRTAAVSERIDRLRLTVGLPFLYYSALTDAQVALAKGIAALEAELVVDSAVK